MEENHGKIIIIYPAIEFGWFSSDLPSNFMLIYIWFTQHKSSDWQKKKSSDVPNKNSVFKRQKWWFTQQQWRFNEQNGVYMGVFSIFEDQKWRGLWLIVTSHECTKGPPNDSLVGLDIYSEMGLYSQLLAGMSSCWACHFWWENPTWKCANKWFTYCPVGSWLELHSGLADSHTWAKFASKLSVSVCCVWYSDFPRIIEYNYTYNSLHTLWYSDFVW